MLCTASRTHLLRLAESSNTLLLMPGELPKAPPAEDAGRHRHLLERLGVLRVGADGTRRARYRAPNLTRTRALTRARTRTRTRCAPRAPRTVPLPDGGGGGEGPVDGRGGRGGGGAALTLAPALALALALP